MVGVPSHEVSAEERQWSPEWIKADTKVKVAEALLQSIDPNISVKWVPNGQVGEGGVGVEGRKIIQLSG
jgi:hypothetical protein